VRKIIYLLMFMLISCQQMALIKTEERDMLKRIGEEFEVVVSIEDAEKVVGINAWIGYDPEIIEVVDGAVGTPGTQAIATDIGFFPNADLVVGIQKDAENTEQPGTLICGCVSDPLTLTDGTGGCFSVRFRAIAVGSTDVTFAQLNLQDLVGDIPANGISDVVDVPVVATVRITIE